MDGEQGNAAPEVRLDLHLSEAVVKVPHLTLRGPRQPLHQQA